MSRLPDKAASRNMSACIAQAMSQVGCRLMVASSANTSLPLAPARCGDMALALATKAAMSSAADGLASGNGPDLAEPDLLEGCADETSFSDFGLVGSPAMIARNLQQALCGTGIESGQCDRHDPTTITQHPAANSPLASWLPACSGQPPLPGCSPAGPDQGWPSKRQALWSSPETARYCRYLPGISCASSRSPTSPYP